MSTGSRQAERSALTQRKLLDAALQLFGEHGYADVSTEQLVRAAGVTRGAMYHQFADKAALFAAVVEDLDARLAVEVGERALAHITDPVGALRAGAAAFLDAVSAPGIRRVLLIDAPSVLGHARWREIGMRHGLGLVEQVITAGVEAGVIRDAPVRPLSQMLVSALDEGALLIADTPEAERAAARAEVDVVLEVLLGSLSSSARS